MEGARRRCARALAHAADQLPHLAPDPGAGGPTAAAIYRRRGRQLPKSRRGTVSVFNGPPPEIEIVRQSPSRRSKRSAAWIADRLREGYLPQEIGVFVRSEAQLDRAREARRRQPKCRIRRTRRRRAGDGGKVSISTMHLAKGLEFRAVAVMACDDEVLPLQERIETVTDESDLEEVYNTERHLLYVACTRARDSLLITGVRPRRSFLPIWPGAGNEKLR